MTNIENGKFRRRGRIAGAASLFFPIVAMLTLVQGCSASQSSARPPATPKPPLVRPIAAANTPAALPWPGFARTSGGVDGAILRVTSLSADGAGSLRQAIEAQGPRLVVLEVGGVIDLGGQSLVVRNPYLTLAGQTAPDPGLTIIRGSLIVETHDVVIQHIAVRPGDGNHSFPDWTPDALGTRRGSQPVHDVVFDHCSATWAVDENLSVSGPADRDPDLDPDVTSHDVTLRHCLIAEGLSHSTHTKGEHSKGTLVHDGVRNVAIIGCLYAHNHERNPRLKGSTRALVSESLMYNWVTACVGVGVRGNEAMLKPAEAVLTANVAVAGPDTRTRTFVKSVDAGGRVFARDNMVMDASGAPLMLFDRGVVNLPSPPEWAPQLPAADPRKAVARVLRSAGARPAKRDPIDARIVRSVIDGTGRIIDSQEDVGGYPLRPSTSRSLLVPDGAAARRQWLDRMSDDLAVDATIDVDAFWRRLGK